MDITEQFEQAVAQSKLLSQKPDNETLLKLYALYKQATEGDHSGEITAAPFDFVARFKQEAWARLRGLTKESAMQQYADLINELKGA
jgi:acyl-CoA-binding protein